MVRLEATAFIVRRVSITPQPQLLGESKALPTVRAWHFSRFSTAAGVFGPLDRIMAASPATCGAACEVPSYLRVLSAPCTLVPALSVERMPTPGAATSILSPKLENEASLPPLVSAATATTLLQPAGTKFFTSALELPAAATTTVPALTALLIAFCIATPQLAWPPRLILITLAGLGLAGTPATLPPAAQVMASEISERLPPHLPSTRIGTTLAP